MRILITGYQGMLGTDLSRILGHYHLVTGLSSKELDVTDLKSVLCKVADYQPDIMINCAAFTNVDACERDGEASYQVNALGPRNLAIACNETNATLLHISTDYVFDGEKESAYQEDDVTNPLNVYGKTKLAGEQYVRTLCNRFYVVRTQWLYGKHGKNFVKTMLSLAQEQNELRVVTDQFGSPTYTKDLAKGLCELIQTKAYGTYHVTNSGVVSWFDFTKDILECAGIRGVQLVPITTQEMNRPATRPKYSPLANFNWHMNGFSVLRNYKEALQEYITDEMRRRVE